MSLSKSGMKSDFEALQDSKPKDTAELAKKWAAAYDSYASGASTGNGGSVINAGKKSGLESTLKGALGTPETPGIPAKVAAGWATGLLAYWGGTPFTPGSVPMPPFQLPGVAAPPLGLGALVPALTALYSKENTASGFADEQASALDDCTKTVLVLFGPVPQPVS